MWKTQAVAIVTFLSLQGENGLMLRYDLRQRLPQGGHPS
jgi:hypothetical protein